MSVIDLTGARLAVTWRSVGTHQVVAVLDDGTVWLWALATIGPGADVVGSFRTDLPPDRWPSVESAVAVLNRAGTADAGRLGITVTSGDRSGWLPLDGGDARTVTDLAVPLMRAARNNPVSAARLTAQLIAAAGTAIAGFTLTSLGTEPVSLLMDRDTFALTGTDGDWQALPPPRMGLVDTAGGLLDGLYQAATIPAGSTGACSIPLTGADDHRYRTGSLRGAVTLVGPWSISPTVPFEIAGVVTEVAGPAVG